MNNGNESEYCSCGRELWCFCCRDPRESAIATGAVAGGLTVWGLRVLGDSQASLNWQDERVPVALVGGATLALFWPLVLLEMPYSADHPVHLTRAWHFITKNLASGQLSGWSDLWFGGWPSGEDYPPLGDYWFAAWYALSLGTLGWEEVYALSFLSMMLASALGVYWFGRQALGRWEGVLAALFFLSDKGAYREGGWVYTVTWGVWPQVLSTGLCFAALGTAILVVKRPSSKKFAVASLLMGLAFLAHPMALVVFALLLPLGLGLTYLMKPELRNGTMALPVGALFLGVGLAAYWFFPFASKGEWMAKYGELWLSLPAMGERWLNGTLFSGTTPALLWLGTLGGVTGIARGRVGAAFCVAGALAFLLAASRTIFHELDLLSLSSSFGQIQFQRFVIRRNPLCLSWLVMGLSLCFRRSLPTFTQEGHLRACTGHWNGARGCNRTIPARGGWEMGGQYGVGNLTLKEDRRHQESYEEFLKWSREVFQGDCLDESPMFGRTTTIILQRLRFGMGFLHMGFTPCTNYIHKADLGTDENYRLLSVRYVVSLEPLRRKSLREMKRFGSLRVYEFADYTPERFSLEGPGKVVDADVRPEDGVLAFQLEGTTEASRLFVHIPPFPNWRATDGNGEELHIERSRFGNFGARMVVPATGDTIALHYETPPVNRWSGGISILAWALLLGLGWRPLRAQVVSSARILSGIP